MRRRQQVDPPVVARSPIRFHRIWTVPCCDGLVLVHADHAPDRDLGAHRLDAFYFIATSTCGRVTSATPEASCSVAGEDVFVVAPGEVGSGRSGPAGWSYRALLASSELMRQVAAMAHGRAALPRFPRLIKDAACAGELCTAHQAAELGMEQPSVAVGLRRFLAGLVLRQALPEEEPTPARAIVDRATALVERSYAEKLTLADLAAAAGVGVWTLIRLFRRELGMTPYHYLARVRTEHGAALLLAGVDPVDAAIGAGFSHQSHFGLHFRRLFGASPIAFAEAVRPGPEVRRRAVWPAP